MRIHIPGLQYYKNCSKFSNIESKYCPEKFLCSRLLGQAGRLDQGRLKSGILTRYACATKNNALGYEKIIVISFVGMQKL